LQKQEQFKDVFVEGPWFYKRNKQYYMMYAGMTDRTECLSYSSDSPTGPWKYQGKIMTGQPTNSFTNHGGIIDFKGNPTCSITQDYCPAQEVTEGQRLLKNSNTIRMAAFRKLQ
jgi:beta-xylosidase